MFIFEIMQEEIRGLPKKESVVFETDNFFLLLFVDGRHEKKRKRA